jgi:hypothetical protein
MNDPMGTPMMEAPKRNNTPMIIGIVVVVLLCCCCIGAGAGYWLWNNGDALMSGSMGAISALA